MTDEARVWSVTLQPVLFAKLHELSPTPSIIEAGKKPAFNVVLPYVNTGSHDE